MKKTFLFLVLVTALVVGSAQAADETTEQQAPAAEQTAEAPSTPNLPIYGMQMWIDEETGAMRAPTAEEATYMSALIQRMFTTKAKVEPRVLKHESGMESIALDESFMEFSVVRIAADGSLEKGCVDNADQALEFIHAPANPNTEEK